MMPAASVSGWYFSHPEARYFGLGKIERDQVKDYAACEGMSLAEMERWWGSCLNYEPGEELMADSGCLMSGWVRRAAP